MSDAREAALADPRAGAGTDLAKATHILLVRHGQTDWNRARRFQGHTDIPLNAVGIEEARRLAQRLSVEPLEAVYSSDLLRAFETARPSAQRHLLVAEPSAELRERSYGIFEGLTVAERAARFPLEHARWASHDPSYVIPGGESQETFRERIFAAVDRIAARHAGRAILIVTHGGGLDMIYRRALSCRWDAERSCPIPNAALNRVAWTPTGSLIVQWGDVAHLGDENRASGQAAAGP